MDRIERLDRSQREVRIEIICRRFAVLSGIRQEADDYTILVEPKPGSRKGTLALLTEPAGDHPSISGDVCRVVQDVVAEQYIVDNSLSLTSGLIGALDAANSAVLRYNFSAAPGNDDESAPRTSSRRVRVGLSAAMLRADGSGVYLAQMAPAQAYIRHNGMITPIPEGPDWRRHTQAAGGRGPLMIVRDEPLTDDLFGDVVEHEELSHEESAMLAPSLGTSPGIETDLIYRRIEAGDLVVLVSSSLGRLLDRETAEEVLSGYDADTVLEALYDLATGHGLAQAHACVLQLGAEPLVRTDAVAPWTQIRIAPVDTELDEEQQEAPDDVLLPNGPAYLEVVKDEPDFELEDEGGPAPARRGTLLSAKSWLGNRLQQSRPTVHDDVPETGVQEYFEDGSADSGTESTEHSWTQLVIAPGPVRVNLHAVPDAHSNDDEPQDEALPVVQTETVEHQTPLPGEVIVYSPRAKLERNVDFPPFRKPVLWDENEEETAFDGWEDALPPLSESGEEEASKVVFPWEKAEERAGLTSTGPMKRSDTGAMKTYPAPTLFSDAPPKEQGQAPSQSLLRRVTAGKHMPDLQISILQKAGVDLSRAGRGVVGWVGKTAGNMLPERYPSPRKRLEGLTIRNRMSNLPAVPVRIVIGLALVIVLGLLGWSVLKSSGAAKQNQMNTYLQQARQQDLLANQPATAPEQRAKALTTALAAAKQASSVDPNSQEARLLVEKVQSEADKVQGVTRLQSVSLLFDTSTTGAAQQGQLTVPVSTTKTLSPSEIIVQGSSIFVLDREHSRLYRCTVATKICGVALSPGDTAGGQKVGTLLAVTPRATSIIALDDKFSVYTLNPDTGAWQAEQLGDADKLQRPSGVATYDGNLYLLNAKPGQVVKYPAGKYGSPPVDWIKDATDTAQITDPAALAIDGVVYALLGNGKIVAMQAGKIIKTFTPPGAAQGGAATSIFTNPDTHDIYALRGAEGSITRINKDGQRVGTYKAPLANPDLAQISGLAVDETHSKVYLVSGTRVYEAVMPAAQTGQDAGNPGTQAAGSMQPGVHPTVEP